MRNQTGQVERRTAWSRGGFSAPGLRLRDRRRGHEVERRLSHASGNGSMVCVSSALARQNPCAGFTRHCQKVTSRRESWHHWHKACLVHKTRLRSGATRGPRNLTRQVSTWESVSSHVLRHIRVKRNVTRSVPWRRLRAEFSDLRTHCDELQTGHIGLASDWGSQLAGAQQNHSASTSGSTS